MAKKAPSASARIVAANVLVRVLKNYQQLDVCLADALPQIKEARDRALTQELCYGVLRWLPQLQNVVTQLLDRPVRCRDLDVSVLLLLGLYQLEHTRIPAHAAVAETVDATRTLGKPWASGLVNATLRRYQKQKLNLIRARENLEEATYAHPQWIIDALRYAWPGDWEKILIENNQRAPMTLRVNARSSTRDAYQAKLASLGIAAVPALHTTHGVTLKHSLPVEQLPGFNDGLVSVQDGAAQLAVQILDCRDGHRVLDACAAPGGKSAHILESGVAIAGLTAVEREPSRAQLLSDTISRLGLSASLITADVRDVSNWWNGVPFERILLDAPCSATGVIRRHPDIKLRRCQEDIDRLILMQTELLESLWDVLVPGGRLVYATCSVLPAENQDQITQFLERHKDAQELPITAQWGRNVHIGRQILPGADAMDGFYYAVVQKH